MYTYILSIAGEHKFSNCSKELISALTIMVDDSVSCLFFKFWIEASLNYILAIKILNPDKWLDIIYWKFDIIIIFPSLYGWCFRFIWTKENQREWEEKEHLSNKISEVVAQKDIRDTSTRKRICSITIIFILS